MHDRQFARLAIRFLVIVAACLPISFNLSQAQSTPRLTFEVSSIKQSVGDQTGDGYRFEPGGRIVIRSYALKYLILIAWHIPEFQLQGISPWMETTHYDIDAVAARNSTPDESRIMLQSLLEDRFRLAVHHETKELSIFALRRNGSAQSGLVPSKESSCTPGPEPRVVPAAPPGTTPLCGLETRLVQLPNDGGPAILMQWRGTPMSFIVRTLATTVGRHIADETNLSGNLDARLQYRPEDFSGKSTPGPGKIESSAPSIFSAMQDQMGL